LESFSDVPNSFRSFLGSAEVDKFTPITDSTRPSPIEFHHKVASEV